MGKEPLEKNDILKLQSALAALVEEDLTEQINKFGEKSKLPNFNKLLEVSRDVQSAINILGTVIESLDK